MPGKIDYSDFQSSVWEDVSPIALDDADKTAVYIHLSEAFQEIMGYFRAIMAKEEKSERALALTRLVIDENAANYTAWFYRRECLKALKSDLKAELDLISDIAIDSPKNYQIWYHRRAIVDLMNDGSKELGFTAEILDDDSKNYHAWSHRQWVLKRFDLWQDELDYVDVLLNEDLRNNSAWNQRWYVIQNTKASADGNLPDNVIDKEILYAQSFIEKAPHNESPYNYLVGLLRKRRFSDFPSIRSHAEVLRFKVLPNGSKPYVGCAPLLGLLVFIYEQENDTKELAISICEELGEKHDKIRRKYWKYRIEKIHT
mmetsp:Transcript_6703/g.7650  ORF Transcript_6703/g.7650 Transcript_6703/m.7650 type:complete len:314 (-) Transcript_6703:9-950(-)